MKKLVLSVLLFVFTTVGFAQVETFNQSTTWTCPVGITTVQVECWGAGGSGGSATTGAGRVGGGGGGGSYLKNTVIVVPGQIYTITVGVGGAIGLTSSAAAYGNPGGNSIFSGPAVTSITASGGAGGTGANSHNTFGAGGILGGVYGFLITNAGSSHTGASADIATVSGGGGYGVTTRTSLTAGALNFVTAMTQGSGYTSVPTVTVSGDGTVTALVSLDVDAGGTITIKGVSGNPGVSATNSGGGGAGGNGGAGGAAVTTADNLGNVGTAPGGGGSGGFSSAAGSRKGGAGADGRIKLTYGALLPVSLTSFTAQNQSTGVQLKWNTASEQNNSHFDVERSTNGTEFYNIGKVKGAGNSKASVDYYFTDKSASTGINYYRLNQVDFDGKTSFSKVVSANMSFNNSSLQVYAPVNSSNLNINIAAEQASTGRLVIYNAGGQKVFEQAISVSKGKNELSVSLATTDKGVFVATYDNGSQVLKKKFVK